MWSVLVQARNKRGGFFFSHPVTPQATPWFTVSTSVFLAVVVVVLFFLHFYFFISHSLGNISLVL